MKIDKRIAERIVREEANHLAIEDIDSNWLKKIQKFSQLCSDGTAKTHVAFLGTSILAKAVDANVSLYDIKPKLAEDSTKSYSARTLCHSVLVPLAAELGIDLGVSGREPLNNQPYFRMTRLGDDTPIHQGGKKAFEYMLELIAELTKIKTQDKARLVLRAFIYDRKQHQRKYSVDSSEVKLKIGSLPSVITNFVSENSEGGRRAQAVVAGLLDVCFGADRVESGRINDPSRKYPGDVCIRSAADPRKFDLAFEVRDKSVKLSDIQIFGKKCIDMSVLAGAVVIAAESQEKIDMPNLSEWSSNMGIRMAIFIGWDQFISQALFWAKSSEQSVVTVAISRIEARLVEVEVSTEAILQWQKLTRLKT
jgi:hypothetical protein